MVVIATSYPSNCTLYILLRDFVIIDNPVFGNCFSFNFNSEEARVSHMPGPLAGKSFHIHSGNFDSCVCWLTHWGRVTHICVDDVTIIGSGNGLSPVRRQAIIWTNAGILLIGPLGTNSSEISIGIQTFSFKKLHLKTSSAKWCLFCLGFNELTNTQWWYAVTWQQKDIKAQQ